MISKSENTPEKSDEMPSSHNAALPPVELTDAHITAQPKADPIYSRETRLDEALIQKLRDLTSATASNHRVHDFKDQYWGHAIVNFIPYAESANIVAKVYLHSQERLTNGDMLVAGKQGKLVTNLIFDVKQYSNPYDLYEIHIVQSNPDIGVGHKLASKSDKDGGTKDD